MAMRRIKVGGPPRPAEVIAMDATQPEILDEGFESERKLSKAERRRLRKQKRRERKAA
jgi:hypothetical protein